MNKAKAFALAADIEDILLRFVGDPTDAETLAQVAEDLLQEAEAVQEEPS